MKFINKITNEQKERAKKCYSILDALMHPVSFRIKVADYNGFLFLYHSIQFYMIVLAPENPPPEYHYPADIFFFTCLCKE